MLVLLQILEIYFEGYSIATANTQKPPNHLKLGKEKTYCRKYQIIMKNRLRTTSRLTDLISFRIITNLINYQGFVLDLF